MKLLPSQQTEKQAAALKRLLETGHLYIYEPCNCGGQIRHNNGGNYHTEIQFRLDGGAAWRTETFSGDYGPPDDWQEVPFSAAIDEIARLAAEGWRIWERGNGT